MEMEHHDKRRHERVKLPYVIKFRSLESKLYEDWDAVTPINMSESGIRFFTLHQFAPESKMQLLVTNPVIREARTYDCKVLRSEKSKNRGALYETVVIIEHIDDDAREAYLKVLDSFIHGHGLEPRKIEKEGSKEE